MAHFWTGSLLEVIAVHKTQGRAKVGYLRGKRDAGCDYYNSFIDSALRYNLISAQIAGLHYLHILVVYLLLWLTQPATMPCMALREHTGGSLAVTHISTSYPLIPPHQNFISGNRQ